MSEQAPAVWGKLNDRWQRLVIAAHVILVLRDDEVPADFRTQFREVIA